VVAIATGRSAAFEVGALTFVATTCSLGCELTSIRFDRGAAGASSITSIVSSPSLDTDSIPTPLFSVAGPSQIRIDFACL
jgi:hypothetical protein